MALTYYELLNVSPGAAPSDIKSAYRTLSKHYHSDRGDELANDAIMRELTAAKNKLLDPVARAEYDYDLAHPPKEQTSERSGGNTTRQSSPASDGYSWGGRSTPPTPPPAGPPPSSPRPHPKPTTPGYWSRRHWGLLGIATATWVVANVIARAALAADLRPLFVIAGAASWLADLLLVWWLVQPKRKVTPVLRAIFTRIHPHAPHTPRTNTKTQSAR